MSDFNFDWIFIVYGFCFFREADDLKVLHYMLGIPPVRTGGLVRYATDLMVQEKRAGVDVYLLIPGVLPKDMKKKTFIYKSRKDFMQIPTYLIYHPLPIPMCNGILAVDRFIRECDARKWKQFLSCLEPDIIHIHTFMGLHRECLVTARELGIPVVFTTHDYFGVCPTALMLQGNKLCEDSNWKQCGDCCSHAFSTGRLRLEQSRGYRLFRRSKWAIGIAKKVVCFIQRTARKQVRSNCGGKNSDLAHRPLNRSRYRINEVDYAVLKAYYDSMFRMVSFFHFNSTLAELIYQDRLGPVRGCVINISHTGICDHRRKRNYGKALRIGYLGNMVNHKGFFELVKACSELYAEGCTCMELHIFVGADVQKISDHGAKIGRKAGVCMDVGDFIRNHPAFGQHQLEEIFYMFDVLAVPSICPETFGFVVLEAVSYGVPVIISECVGAKDILDSYPEIGFIYSGQPGALKKMIQRIYEHRELLEYANAAILKMDDIFHYQYHIQKMLRLYGQCSEK